MGSKLLEDLNEAQRQAVTHGEGPLLLLAGAGSGKTRAITRRVAYLILERGIAPESVLAITFTNKAASEMKQRVSEWVHVPGMWISTFHSMCARILRQEIEAVHFGRNFSIYDTQDRDILLREILREQGVDTTRFRPAQVGSMISNWKNHRITPEQAIAMEGFEQQRIAKAYRRYTERMKDFNALDFDDLLLFTLELFENHASVRDRYAERFKHLLIDEYQDTNRVQYLIARNLAQKWKNICCCGDPDQSIYAWRGADLSNILDFEKDFGQAKTVKLEQNYRSTKNILGAAESVIRNNRSRKPKTLWTENESGEQITLLENSNELEEAREIAAQIRGLHAKGIAYKDIAVFYRVNFLQRALEAGLREFAIPYQVVAGVEFFERREIKDLLAYLRVLVNPKDSQSLLRVLQVPPRGIGDGTLEKLAQYAEQSGLSVLETFARAGEIPGLSVRSRKALQEFSALLTSFSGAAESPAGETLQSLVERISYFDYVGKLGSNEDLDRVENVEELLSYAREYDQRFPEGKLKGFLEEVALVTAADRQEQDSDRAALMTLHSAKGLEFPVVFIAGCEEGLIPHARSLEEGEGLEEERRLFYVGMTRARQKLFLSFARSRNHFGSEMPQGCSRFLREIPTGLFESAEEEETEPTVNSMAESFGEFRFGDLVRHAHFGTGRVMSLQGSGVNTRILVDFTRFGPKLLLLPYANLEKAEVSS